MAQQGGLRAQSSVIGVVLLLGITVTSVGLIVTVGSDSLNAMGQQMELSSAEHAMMELDSKITLVAHGGSSSQNVNLPQDRGSSLRVDEMAGWMNVTIVNATSGEVNDTVTNQTMGALIYQNGDTEIAYQNGGVWRHSNGGSVMVSPPEAHYRGNTLTLPMIRIEESGTISRNSVLKEENITTGIYPSESDSRTNPLRRGQVNLTVHSKYYQAWGDYFLERTNGDVSYDHENNIVTLELVVPFGSGYSNVIGTSSPGGIEFNGGSTPEPYDTGLNYPSADTRIEDKISECDGTGACNSSISGTLTAGDPYYTDSDLDSDIKVDTTDGNVTVVVNGSIPEKDFDLNITGDNKTTLMLKDGIQKGGRYNEGGDPGQLSILVHSDGEVTQTGSELVVYGLLYAPGSDCDINGGPEVEIRGGVICDTFTTNGNTDDFTYDESIEDFELGLEGENTVHITYLHISRTNVTVGS